MPSVIGGASVDGVMLQAQADYEIPGPPVETLIEFSDFLPNNAGLAAKAGKKLDKVVIGPPNRRYRMVPNTSTKAAEVNAQANGSSILYNMLVAGGLGESTRESGIHLANFILEGTAQGHSYNGVNVRYSTSPHVHDIGITGIRGTKSSPPEETFGISFWHANGARGERINIDGQNVAATLFGLNSSMDVILEDCVAHNTLTAFAIAMWQSGNVHIKNFDGRTNRRCVNIERPYGDYHLEGIDVRGTSRPHIVCNGDGIAGGGPVNSVELLIEEPIIDIPTQGPLRVGISPNPYLGRPQTQQISDVQVIMGGVDVTNDTSKVLIGNVW